MAKTPKPPSLISNVLLGTLVVGIPVNLYLGVCWLIRGSAVAEHFAYANAVSLAVGLIGGTLLFLGKLRDHGLAHVADTLGLRFAVRSRLAKALDTRIAHTSVARSDSFEGVLNVASGVIAGQRVRVFDVRDSRPAGDCDITILTTVLMVRCTGLPVFQISPGKMSPRAAARRRIQRIAFDEAPRFTQRYDVQGPNESAIRTAIGPELLAHLADADQPWSIESTGEFVLVYRPGERVSAKGYKSFVCDALTTLRVATAAERRPRGARWA
ncbi:MAG: hypothetical protein KDC87_22290, partial [Planctomycetes bacterium]|nr:hypothetical protein [Planctomycetota bacterium]